MILRDDHEDDWTEAADSTLERRVYYCQNWRADVVALLAENGRIVERAWYEPYGTPHGLNPGDFGGTSSSGDDHYLVPDGDSDSDDATTYLALFGGSNALSDTTGSSDPGDGEYGRPNGVIDSDDYFYFLDRAGDAATLGRNVLSAGHDGATASHGAGNLRNRRGLAGYEWDPHVRRYHVRNRVMYPEVGRWTRRDPDRSTYARPVSRLYSYDLPLSHRDWDGRFPRTVAPPGVVWAQPLKDAPRGGDPVSGDPGDTDLLFTTVCCAWYREQANDRLWWDTLKALPNCQCRLTGTFDNPDDRTWEDPSIGPEVPLYHPGAAACMRSIPVGPHGPGQQCCYDASGRLITEGLGAGSPDRISPKWPVRHFFADVHPYHICAAAGSLCIYEAARPPNNGNGCERNAAGGAPSCLIGSTGWCFSMVHD